MDFKEYFEEVDIFLQEIKFTRKKSVINSDAKQDVSIIISDSLFVEDTENSVMVIVKRTICFEPEAHFELSVEYGSRLEFKAYEERIEKDWENLFLQDDEFVIPKLMANISLECARITSEVGSVPLITPPQFMRNEK